MHRINKLGAIGFTIFLHVIIGCVSREMLIDEVTAREPNCKLDSFMGKSEVPDDEYKIACRVYTKTFKGILGPNSKALRRARGDLCECGADGVIIEKINDRMILYGIIYDKKNTQSSLAVTFEERIKKFECSEDDRFWIEGKCSDLKYEMEFDNRRHRSQ